MAHVVSWSEVQGDRVQKTGRSGMPYWRTSFITPAGDDDPQAYLIENSPEMTIASHYHDVDQFQIFVRGEGSIGRTDAAPVSVHFARAFTTYGPIENRREGLAWMTLRPRRDLGAKMIDTHRETLEKAKDRKPWQTTLRAEFAAPAQTANAPASVKVIDGERGLAATALTLRPGEVALAADPSSTPCQYILVTGGSLLHDGVERRAFTVVHVPPTDAAFRLAAGAQGLQCLVLHFPHIAAAAEATPPQPVARAGAAADATAWHCELCGFVYQQAEGLPESGIAPGTAWADIPDDFQCPDCAAQKPDFTPLTF